MRPSAPQTGSNTVELHRHGVVHMELRGLVLEGTVILIEQEIILLGNHPMYTIVSLVP